LALKQLLFIGILSMLYGFFSSFLYIGGAGIRAKHIASPPPPYGKARDINISGG
jgi:hypothetical protein